MTCPGCDGELKPESVGGFDYSYRCGQCAGFWMANWVVNNLSTGKELRVSSKNEQDKAWGGKNLCPTDAVVLTRGASELVPGDLAVEKCGQCGWWWFPGDELFKFIEAMAVRNQYVKIWRKNDWTAYAWPALVIAVMVAGLAGSVTLVRNQQKAAIEAGERVQELSVIQTGDGQIEIRFRSKVGVRLVEVKKVNDLKYEEYETLYKDGFYFTEVKNLSRGIYLVKILDRETSVEVK